jgi:hypothetical protein
MFHKWEASFLGLFVAGCTALPDLPQQSAVSVSDVVNSINCEFKAAVLNERFVSEDKGWLATSELKLQVVAAAGAELGLNLSSPLNPGTLLVAVGGGYSGSADRTAGVTFETVLKDPRIISCRKPSDQSDDPLVGNLGIHDWIAMLQESRDEVKDFSVFSHELKFTIERKGNIDPSFSLVPLGSSKLGGGAKIGGSRKHVHSLEISFKKNKDAPKNGKPSDRDSKENMELLEKLTNPVITLE